MSYVLCPKNSIRGLENVISGHFSVHFRWNLVESAPKDSSLNYRGSLLSHFWATVLISAVISIYEDFGSLLPARTVTVKWNIMVFKSSIINF